MSRAAVESLEALDNWAHMRNVLRDLSVARGDWSGIPMPLDGQRLVIEPTFQYKGLADICDETKDDDEPPQHVRNIFWSVKLRCLYAICQDPDGTVWGAPLVGSGNQARALLNTLGASDAWGIEQESKAVQLLGTLLRHRQFKQYLLTGMFLETSPRSSVTYLFRKLRPTVAIRNDRLLCTLCMHPIAYYEESWAGAMCPTDDVIAHLVLMRGDERMLWRRCAQHPPGDPASGL